MKRAVRPLLALVALAARAAAEPPLAATPQCTRGREIAAPEGGWLDAAAARLGGDPALETGSRAETLLASYRAAVCADHHVVTWLVATCDISAPATTLFELRRRIARDLVRAPGSVLERFIAGMMEDAQREHLVAVAVLDTLLTGGGTGALGDRLARFAMNGVNATSRDLCALGPPGTATALQAQSPMLAAARVLELLGRADRLPERNETYLASIEELLARERRAGAGGKLSAAQAAVATRLIQNARELARARRMLADPGDTRRELSLDLARRFARVAEDAVTLVDDARVELPRWTPALLGAVMEGRPSEALAALEQSLIPISAQEPIPKAALDAWRLGIRLGAAASEPEAEAVLTGSVEPEPPWTGDVLFDLNGVLLLLEGGDAALGGDLTLGLSQRTWGVALSGGLGEYAFAGDTLSRTRVRGGGVELWGVLGPDAAVKVEARVGAEASQYASELEATEPAALALSDEDSLMARGALLLGLRIQAGRRFAAGLWAGGGAQYEIYEGRNLVAGTKTDEKSLGPLLRARLRLQHHVAPRWLTLRVRVDADRHGITRDAGPTARTIASQQLEIAARLFVDAEAASFGGFVPGLGLGAESFSLAPDGAPGSSTLVPSLGLALRREVF